MDAPSETRQLANNEPQSGLSKDKLATGSSKSAKETGRPTSIIPATSYLNKFQVNIMDLRKFLAGLSNEGVEEIPAGALWVAVKTFSRLDISPLRETPTESEDPRAAYPKEGK